MDFEARKNCEQKYPCVADMQVAAERRLPKLACQSLFGANGRGRRLDNNRHALDSVKFTPRYLSSAADYPDCSTHLFGRQFDAPFGVEPIRLGGLVWPKADEYLARAAHTQNLPFTLSS